jgi:hypothetical protein
MRQGMIRSLVRRQNNGNMLRLFLAAEFLFQQVPLKKLKKIARTMGILRLRLGPQAMVRMPAERAWQLTGLQRI